MFPKINSESNLPPVDASPSSANNAPTDDPNAPAASVATVTAAPVFDLVAS